MSIRRDDELDLLAAEYVLGTLTPDERKRFAQRLADNDDAARAALADWEHRLGQIGEALTPVAPPESAWQQIADRVGIARRSGPADVKPATNDAPTRMRRWRGLALAASAATVILAATLLFGMPGASDLRQSMAPAYASMIYDRPTGMSWLITGGSDGADRLSIEAMGHYDVPSGKTLRLWIKPEGQPARFVGELPASPGRYAMDMSPTVKQALENDSQFMVSMEDASRVAARPSGEIMWIAPVGYRTG